MSTDETYLEGFIEGLSTLPQELRRQLELIRSLDTSAVASLAELRRLQQEYIYQVEQKMSEVEVVQSADGTVLGLREDPSLEPMFPSTEELFDFVNDPDKYKRIKALQRECLQKAEEKVAVARQSLELIDAKVQRLDHDLSAMETLLQVRPRLVPYCFAYINVFFLFYITPSHRLHVSCKATGEFQSGVVAKPNDMAACQVTPGSEWILAKVLHHDVATGMYKLADEDVESNKGVYRRWFVFKGTSLNISPALYYYFTIAVFHLPEQQVQILQPVERLRAGDTVHAVYPDTTSFYKVLRSVRCIATRISVLATFSFFARLISTRIFIFNLPGYGGASATQASGRWSLCHAQLSRRCRRVWNYT